MATEIARTEFNHLAAVRSIARLMDSAVTIPGLNVRLGLDTLLGLLPGIGDAIGSAVGGYIILIASQLGVSRAVLARMTLNQGIDMLVGAIPFVGDLFDIGWKANLMNARLLEEALNDPQSTNRHSIGIIIALIAALLILSLGSIALTIWLVSLFWK